MTGVDVSAILKPGVYLLRANGVVVYIAKSKCPLAHIAAHRSLARKHTPSWLPLKGIVFDSVEVIPSHPDRIVQLEADLIAVHRPRLNLTQLKIIPNENPSPRPCPQSRGHQDPLRDAHYGS